MINWIPLSTGRLPKVGESVLICLPSLHFDDPATPAVAWLIVKEGIMYWAFDDNRSYMRCELTKASHFAYIDMPEVKEERDG